MEEQETTYAYEDDYNASLITKETFGGPNSEDVIEKKYYFDGSLQSREDARGVQIGYTYNDGTRLPEYELLLKLPADVLPADVDGAIQSIKREYDDRRRLTHVRSFDAEAAIKNDVEFVYHDFDRLQYFRQSHEGATTESSPQVQYDYETDAVSGVYRHALRHMRTDYPSGKRIYTSYNSDDSYDDRLHRVHQKWGNLFGSDKTLLEYKYNGTRRVAEAKYPAPDIDSPLYTSSPIDFDTLDRFGRVKSKLWKATATLDQVDYTHDFASNRTTRYVDAAPDLNQTYFYDGIHRLDLMMGSGTFIQDWILDSWGNWSGFSQSGGGTTPISQTRKHSNVNEIEEIDSSSAHVGHDEAGNMTRIPKPADWNAHYDLVYDAWNRLVKVNNASSSIEYEYDGLHRRIVKKVGADTYDYYYNVDYQVLEVRKNGSTNPLEQYAWHPYYIDALAMRYYDADTDGSGDEQYATHDANFNVTALIDVNGTAIERYHYTPYGQLIVLDADYVPTNNPSTVDNPYAFTGRRLDSETGLYYFRNRYYHSQLGRFVTRDPIGYKANSNNLYQYVEGRPTTSADPFGLRILLTGLNDKQRQYVSATLNKLANSNTPIETVIRDAHASSDVLIIEFDPGHEAANLGDGTITLSDKGNWAGDRYNNDTATLNDLRFRHDGNKYLNDKVVVEDIKEQRWIVLTHELGHQVFAREDDNVTIFENPVREWLAEPYRTKYDGVECKMTKEGRKVFRDLLKRALETEGDLKFE
jgi:RHS repeat-associated protein